MLDPSGCGKGREQLRCPSMGPVGRWALDLVSSGHWGAPGMGQRGLGAGWCGMDATPWSRIRTRTLPWRRSNVGGTGVPHTSCPVFLGFSPSPLPTSGTGSPRCPGLQHDSALPGQDPLVSYSWSRSNTTEHGGLLRTRRSFCEFFSLLFSVHSTCPSSSSSSLLHHALHHPPHLCLLCPGHGSGHKDTSCDLPAELLRGCSSGERAPQTWGITGTRCHPGGTEAAQEMTGMPVFPVGRGR